MDDAVIRDEAATAREEVLAELAASDLQSRRLAAGVATLMTAEFEVESLVWRSRSRVRVSTTARGWCLMSSRLFF